MAKRRRKVRQKRQIGFPLAMGAIIVVGLVLIVVSRGNPPGERPEPPEGVETVEITSADHVSVPVPYDRQPPAGGPHFETPQTCGYYSEPIVTENAVHSLEHGAVWVTYDPGLEEAAVASVRRYAAEPYVIVSPFEDNPSPIVVTAWARQLELDSSDDPRLLQFIRAFARGGEAPEPGGPCAGIGSPE